MKIPYKNQHGEVIREGVLHEAHSEEDINVFFSFDNELDVINKHVQVISNLSKPENIYTLRKGVRIETLMACGLRRDVATRIKNQKFFSRKNIKFKYWKKINHLVEPLAVEKHVALEDGRIVKFKDYEAHLKKGYHRFLAKKNLSKNLGIPQKKIALETGISFNTIHEICMQRKTFSTNSPLYHYLLKKNAMDLCIYMDDELYERFKKWRKEEEETNDKRK